MKRQPKILTTLIPETGVLLTVSDSTTIKSKTINKEKDAGIWEGAISR